MKTTPTSIAARLSLIAAAGLLGACSSMGSAPMASSQSGLPDPIKVPAGKTLDRKGRPLMITLKGTVEAFYK